MKIERLQQLLQEGDTHERCGLILKRNRIIEVENKAEDPTQGFEIPVEDMVKYEDSVIGTWHTHPNGTASYSMMDHVGFTAWPKLTHWIIGQNEVRSYTVKDGIVYNGD